MIAQDQTIANFECYEVNTADIFRNEFNQFIIGDDQSYLRFYQVYDNLKTFLKNRIEPFLSPETVQNGKYKQFYYDSYMYDRLPKRDYGFALESFEYRGRFYNLYKPFTVEKANSTDLEFQFFFSQKLKQYKDGLRFIPSFLYYHLKKNFDNDLEKIKIFLNHLLSQYKDSLDSAVIKEIDEFISDPAVLLTLKKEDWNDFENLPEIPNGFKVIEGKLSRQEILKFFSFLFLEQSKDGKPFLNKQEVYEIFKFGIAVPPKGALIPLHKLNCSKWFPKSIMSYSIYQFYRHFTDDVKLKREILRFFAIYLYDYNDALFGTKNLENLNKNITTRESPIRMGFDLKKYLPERCR